MSRLLLLGNCNGFGGAQTAFRRLADFLVTAGHETAIIGICEKRTDLGKVSASGPHCQLSPISLNLPNRCQRVWEFLLAARTAKAFRPDMFITVGLTRSGGRIAQCFDRKTFKVCQDFIYGRSVDDPLLKQSCACFDSLVVQTPAMEGLLRARGFSGLPLTWLPCFPNPPVPGVRHEVRGAFSTVRLGFFGRLAKNKGLSVLLEAMWSARFDRTVTLDIWGDGPEREEIDACRRRFFLEDKIQIRGPYPTGDEYARLLSSYDALVLPSQGCEGLPLILLEAMSYGVPFLATDVGAISDCCRNNPDSILVGPSTEKIRRGLEDLAQRLVANRLSAERLQRYYTENFSTSVMRARWSQFIESPGAFCGNVVP